ncbi:hypothetical protein PF008_g618 [Phytophthora fragariae]|uniref:Reverse transcriptase domain-containing protein n=1 Tax=Phytophthora fragariae TaxID=53985 RepID=A0A6G0SPB6_9STRA|nr:hypothetical protein PF008_g618 [Phytophthora fragariae]
MLEAAKEICKENGELTEAQVLLLDFAKAYDSLDRDFVMAILNAKGFPPKWCNIIRATHTNTTVQFLANGHLSDKVVVTSGIRQGCPLAPLLFIIAVDLLYDVIEGMEELEGIQLEGSLTKQPLKVAGYADDTAIYVAHRNMQKKVIEAVHQFSAIAGLKLNVQTSAAIDIGCNRREETEEGDDEQLEDAGQTPMRDEVDTTVIEPTDTVRYLGHIAGSGDSAAGAWEKAFAALRVRLVLAEAKTNSVQQRAAIAAAIIIPKMLYVARHAWPTEEIVKKADLCIRHYV